MKDSKDMQASPQELVDQVRSYRDLLNRLGHHLTLRSELSDLHKDERPFLREMAELMGWRSGFKESGKVANLLVEAQVRYWDDALVNGVEDDDGSLIPGRVGDIWRIMVDLQEGRILNWPEGTTADIHYKVCDAGEYWLTNKEGHKIAKYLFQYVPSDLLCHGESEGYGDYIIMQVDASGNINDYNRPQVLSVDRWKILPQPS